MKLILWGWLLALALCFPPATPGAETSHVAAAKHSLWKAETKGQTNALYLFGSVHLLNKKFYPLPLPIENAYKVSDVVVFEVDINEGETPEAMAKFLKFGKYDAGKTLKSELSKEAYEKLQKHMAGRGLPIEAFHELKPWMVTMTLAMLELQKLGLNPAEGVDRYFFDKASKDKKKIVPLETIDDQLSLFDALTDEEDDKLIEQTLADLSNYSKEFTKLLDAWKTGDSKALENILLEAFKDYPEIYKKFLTDRNKAWIAKLQKLNAERKNVFVVVGAAHLVGKESVVELLQKQGLKVTQQ